MRESLIVPARWTEAHKQDRREYHCVHRHSGLSHPKCYEKELGIRERIGCLDIECGGLDADFSIMLSWAIKLVGDPYPWHDWLTKDDLVSGKYDARLVATLIDKMWECDRVVTHYGNAGRFDVPFIRARYFWLKARKLYDGPPFPEYGELWQSDTYTMSKRTLKISSRRQGSVANVVQAEDIKTRIDKDYWMAIQYGTSRQRKEAIEYIVTHNLKDVEQLEGNYLTLKPFVREVRSSI